MDESVERWSLNLRPVTFTMAHYVLRRFCGFVGMGPDELVEARKDELRSGEPEIRNRMEERVKRFMRALEAEGKRSSTVYRYVTIVKSFFQGNYYPLNVKNPEYGIEKKRVNPSKEELRLMVEGAPIRDKALILLMAQSGLSKANIIDLKLEDVDLTQELPKLELFRKKKRTKFHTFVHPETKKYIQLYLKERQRGTEYIPPDSFGSGDPLFVSYKRKPLSPTMVWKLVGKACKRVDVKHHYPHSLRSFFANACRKAGVQERFIDYMLGHKPKMGGAYFPLDDLEANYRKAISELSTREAVSREALERERKTLKEKMIEVDAKIAELEGLRDGFDGMKAEIYQELEKKFRLSPFMGRVRIAKPIRVVEGYEVKVIPEEELTRFLEEGWEVFKQFKDGRFIVRRLVEDKPS